MDDAGLVAERSAAYTIALLGFAKHSVEDVANYLRDPGFDPATDGWVVVGADGEFAGSATAMASSDGSRVNLEVLSEIPAVAEWLLDRASGAGRGGRRGEVVVSVGVIRQDEVMPEIVAAKRIRRSRPPIHRMRITYDGAVLPPPVPGRCGRIRRGAYDDSSRRAGARRPRGGLRGRSRERIPAAVRRVGRIRAESRSTFDWSAPHHGRARRTRRRGRRVQRQLRQHRQLRLHRPPRRRTETPAARASQSSCCTTPSPSTPPPAAPAPILHVDSSNPTPAVAPLQSSRHAPDLTSNIWRLGQGRIRRPGQWTDSAARSVGSGGIQAHV